MSESPLIIKSKEFALQISLKECSESEYWLELLIESGYYENREILNMCIEVKKLLVSSLNTAKTKLNK